MLPLLHTIDDPWPNFPVKWSSTPVHNQLLIISTPIQLQTFASFSAEPERRDVITRDKIHPSGRIIQMLPPITTIIPAHNFMRQTLHNVHVLMFQSVKSTTRGAYWTGWNHWVKWVKWVKLVGTKQSMHVVPPDFTLTKKTRTHYQRAAFSLFWLI